MTLLTKTGAGAAPTPGKRGACGRAPLLGGHRQRRHRDMHAVVGLALEGDVAVDQREDGVVAAEADIAARLPAGAALAEDDVACHHRLATGLLEAEAPAFRIAPVAGRTACLFMCHLSLSLGRGDLGDAQHGHVLAVAVLATAVLPAALLEDDDRVQPVLGDHGRGHGGAGDGGGAHGEPGLAADGEDVGEGDGGAGFGFQLLDLQHGVRGDAVLLSAGADDCEHRSGILSSIIALAVAPGVDRPMSILVTRLRRPGGTGRRREARLQRGGGRSQRASKGRGGSGAIPAVAPSRCGVIGPRGSPS
ncbi:protein of unknown function [Rhodovastum atsumiense]|nr:protein of unknown function [Rhodovastum atsumiense]